MPSYTHRQVAIPVLGRVWMEGALSIGLRRDRALLTAVRAELSRSPLGAGAIGGTTLPIDTSVTAAALALARRFGEGLLGHITVRDPEHADRLWVNPLGVSFRQMRVTDLVQVNHQGELTHGERPVNPVGLRLHVAVHAAVKKRQEERAGHVAPEPVPTAIPLKSAMPPGTSLTTSITPSGTVARLTVGPP